MIKKIIGLILICLIFFFTIKVLTTLPDFSSLNDIVIGQNKSPLEIGSDYVNQFGKTNSYNSNFRYGFNNIVINQKKILSRISLEKSYGKLILSVEEANPPTDLNIWLTNTPDITNQTSYIDFGPLYEFVGTKTYVVDMNNGDISLSEYNTVLIIDKNYKIYAKVILK